MKYPLLALFFATPLVASATLCQYIVEVDTDAQFTPSGNCQSYIPDAKQKMKNSKSYILSTNRSVELKPNGNCSLEILDRQTRTKSATLTLFSDHVTCHASVKSSQDFCITKTLKTGNLGDKIKRFFTGDTPKVKISVTPGNCSGNKHLYTID